MNCKTMFLSLIAWAAFTVLVGHGPALVASACWLRPCWRQRSSSAPPRAAGVKIIDAAGVVTFGVLTLLAFAGDESLRRHLADYVRGSAALVLAVVMLGSLLVVPFSEQCAREAHRQQYWGSPRFHAVNRQISVVWGLAVRHGRR